MPFIHGTLKALPRTHDHALVQPQHERWKDEGWNDINGGVETIDVLRDKFLSVRARTQLSISMLCLGYSATQSLCQRFLAYTRRYEDDCTCVISRKETSHHHACSGSEPSQVIRPELEEKCHKCRHSFSVEKDTEAKTWRKVGAHRCLCLVHCDYDVNSMRTRMDYDGSSCASLLNQAAQHLGPEPASHIGWYTALTM